MSYERAPTQDQRRGPSAEQQHGQASTAAPGKQTRTAALQLRPAGTLPPATQRKAASPTEADWTRVAFRPDLYGTPEVHAPVQSKAEIAASSASGSLQRKTDTSLANTAVQRKPASVQAKTVNVLNFQRLAERIHDAIDGMGTDEEAVYSALSALGRNKDHIDELKRVYNSNFGNTLKSDIDDDFSGSELSHALSLITPKADGDGASKGADAKDPPKGLDYAKLAERLHDAIAGMGTDEEAVYAVLSQLGGDKAKVTKLSEAYQSAYSTTLKSDLLDDFSGDELTYVLELIGDRQTGEQVNVASDDEAKKAAAIIKRIYVNYGIDVNSQAGVDAIRKDYDNVPDTVRDSLKTTAWEYRELVALEKALAHFGPILGSKRKDSTRNDSDQEITTVSKVDQAIDENTAAGVLDTTTLGEYFEDSTNFSMFTAGENSTIDFSDNSKQLEGTAVHEIAHGVMKYALSDYVAKLDYWDSTYKKSGISGAEAPITDYGSNNASEDLSEAVMYYFVDRNTLKSGQSGTSKGQIGNPCPERDAFIEATIKKWESEKSKK